MKKKGLIISTVVMVVVLIAALTTATYAWFTASTKTEISGFDVSVVSANAVNIGMKKEYGFSSAPSPTEFATGSVTFAAGGTITSGPGKITSPGSWAGTSDGFSATLDHNINWGSQPQAVGVTTATDVTAENVAQKATLDNTKFWVNHTVDSNNITYGNANTGKTAVVAANKAQGSEALTGQKLARANVGASEDTAGDYVHFILGVQPTKELATNNFIIMITPSGNTSTLGVLASIHVAYRVKADGQTATGWTEVDVYGANHGTTKVADVANAGVSDSVQAAYKSTYENAAVPTGSAACVISGLDTVTNKVSQVEVVIYMAGADSDCTDTGKTASGEIKMFFETTNAATQATTATIDSSNKLTITGGDKSYTSENTTVKINNVAVTGKWENGTFTSTNAVTDVTAGTTKVTIQTAGKEAKELIITAA